MNFVEENVPLAPHTTLGVGGCARFFANIQSRAHLHEVLHSAVAQGIGVCVLGGGSNMLVPDEGVDGLVLHMKIPGITSRDDDPTTGVLVHAGGGVMWDTLVRYATTRGLWGIENLAGIPGTVGGAPVQNIGAYGTELSDTFVSADVVTFPKGERLRIDASHAQFGYRESIFKKDSSMIITGVTLRLSRERTAHKIYPDLEDARARGVPLDAPSQIASALQDIRSRKFPKREEGGTAGSFFKNPIISRKKYDILHKRFPGLPGFPTGTDMKISLAWVLDNVLHMRGFRIGNIYLNERQPLVLVVCSPSSAKEIEEFAREIAVRVKTKTEIDIEREVRLCKLTECKK